MNLNEINNNSDIVKRTLLLMKYDNSKTLLENSNIINEQKSGMSEAQLKETYGNCLNKLMVRPNIGQNDGVSKVMNKYSKAIGESFSYMLHQRTGWASTKFDTNTTTCKDSKLSINGSFKADLERFKKDSPSLPNPPYFCYNQNARDNRWGGVMDENLKSPNYTTQLFNEFGTLNTCTIFGLLESIEKFDWDAADKKDWEDVLIGVGALSSIALPGIGMYVALAADLALTGLYYSEGKYYDAGFTLALGIIPFGDIAKTIPGVRKLGKEGFQKLVKKLSDAVTSKKYSKLIQEEKEVLKGLVKEGNWISKKAAQIVKKVTIYKLSKLISLEQLLKIMYKYIKWSKKNPFKNMLIQIGGIWYSYDKLADIYGIKNVETKNEAKIKELESQTNDEVIKSTLEEVNIKLTDEQYDAFLKLAKENINKE